MKVVLWLPPMFIRQEWLTIMMLYMVGQAMISRMTNPVSASLRESLANSLTTGMLTTISTGLRGHGVNDLC